jgi:glucose-1-phosphate thymidylyltransferase
LLVGLVPMGGRAERWQPYPCPKELLPYGQGPDKRPRVAADWVLDRMAAAGVEQIIIPVRAEKASLVMGYFGHRLAGGAAIVYVAAPGPSLLADLQACMPLMRGHRIVFGMPDTCFAPRSVFARCLEVLDDQAELVLGSFWHPVPDELDVVTRDDLVLRAVLPKPRSSPADSNEIWGVAVWDDSFSKRLAAWQSADGPNLGDVFAASAAAGRGRCVYFSDGFYEDLASYSVYQESLSKRGASIE